MTCALLIGAYILWTSTSGHVGRYTVRQSRVDWGSSSRHRVSYDVRGLHKTQFTTKTEAGISDQLKDLDNQVSNHRISLLGNSVSSPYRRIPVYGDNVQPISVTPSERIQRIRPVVQKHQQHVSRQEQLGQISSAAATESNVSRYKGSRRRNRWRLVQDLRAAKTGLLSGDRRENEPLVRNTASANVTRSVEGKHDVTQTPLLLVVPVLERVTESVEVFREPEIVIRAADADMPRNGRVWSNSGGVASEFGPGGGKRSPLLGTLRGGPGNCRVYNVRADVPELVDFAAGVECLDLATTPAVVVCPYPDADDRHLSQPLRTHGVWEPHIVRLFQAALLNDNQLGVYDIGANIGQYSLLAAAMGRRVVAVEMHRPNIYRLHKAIKLGRLEDKVSYTETDKVTGKSFGSVADLAMGGQGGRPLSLH